MENIKGIINIKDANKNRLISEIELYITEINETDKANQRSYRQKNYDPMQDLLKVYHYALRLVSKHKDLLNIDPEIKKYKKVANLACDFTKKLFKFTTHCTEVINNDYLVNVSQKMLLNKMQIEAEESCNALVKAVDNYIFENKLNDVSVKISITNQNIIHLTKQYKEKCAEIEKLEKDESKYKITSKKYSYQKKLKNLYSQMFTLKDQLRIQRSNLHNLESKRNQLIAQRKDELEL